MGTERTRPTTDEADRHLLADIAGAKAKHTPGPWHAGETVLSDACAFISIIDDSDSPHDIIRNGETSLIDNAEANASLIAAAPDLLAACKEAKFLAAHGIGAVTLGEDEWSRANSDRNIGEIKRIMAIIDAAIAKAEGNPTT